MVFWHELPTSGNGQALARAAIPRLDPETLAEVIAAAAIAGGRLASLSAAPATIAGQGRFELLAVLARPDSGQLAWAAAEVGGSWPTLTRLCPMAHLFEREMAERLGLRPEGHPWLKPVRFLPIQPGATSPSAVVSAQSQKPVGVMDFYRVEGDQIHEVAVGPVHAGVIEPGHFRFQCAGETVLNLEISLGYQHRGVEAALLGGPHQRTLPLLETLAGDTTIGHVLAGCEALEGLAGVAVPPRAAALRAVALELERLANHVGDLGALAGDVGYLPTSSYCGRLRGDLLNLTALLCGSRFGRGMVRPGGVVFDVDRLRVEQLLERLRIVSIDIEGAIGLLWETPSVLARFEGTGRVYAEDAAALGLVGPAARACGLELDCRYDHPSGWYRYMQLPVSCWETGDVFARAYVRWLEIQRSLTFIREVLLALPPGAIRREVGPLAANQAVATLVEGWRGQICHVLCSDAAGRCERLQIVDPSFFNWTGLGLALREQEISDFPLCNKSFNLSYCGHDL